MRVLALDWGEVRVGAAVSDPTGHIAFALDKIIESKKAVNEIKNIVEDLQVEKILVGNPKSLSGTETQSSEKVGKFVDELKAQINLPIEMLDERFSSVEATKKLNEQGMKEVKQRTIKDNIAAQILLQSYLDKN